MISKIIGASVTIMIWTGGISLFKGWLLSAPSCIYGVTSFYFCCNDHFMTRFGAAEIAGLLSRRVIIRCLNIWRDMWFLSGDTSLSSYDGFEFN